MPTYQQSILNGMDRALQARDPGLVSLFAIFTGLTRDDGPPRTERLGHGSGSLAVAFRRNRTSVTIPILIVIALMAAIIALGVAAPGGTLCPPAVAERLSAQSKPAGCQVSAYGLLKLTPGPR